MNQLFKLKFKMHKFVNIIFYLIIFLIGFLIGLGVKKISFNNVLSRVLMIDNVSAASIDNYNTFDEEFIYNSFTLNSEFDINEYPYIGCKYYILNSYPTLYCFALNKDDLEKATYTTGSTGGLRNVTIKGLNGYYYFNYRISNSSYVNSSTYNTSTTLTGVYTQEGNNHSWIRTNFDFPGITSTSYMAKNVLDFSKYSVKLEYNENLFKDNPNFKEVCVNNYDTFSITSNGIQDYDENNSPMYHSFDFMWFPNGMKGISTWGYDSEEHDHVYIFEESENTFSGWWYWLDTKDEIDKYFGRDNPGIYLSSKGYKDKYSYYNWTFYPFEMTFTESYYRYQVFWFKDPYIEYLDGSKKDDSEQYCFYIKNEYDVNILNRNENGDFNSNITILGGIEKNDFTYKNELNNNYNGFFSNINNVISKLRPTISFINLNILKLYTSMPLIVRNFILAFLTLILIRIIIGMVIK